MNFHSLNLYLTTAATTVVCWDKYYTRDRERGGSGERSRWRKGGGMAWNQATAQFICCCCCWEQRRRRSRRRRRYWNEAAPFVCVCADFLNWPKGYSFLLIVCVSHSFIIQFVVEHILSLLFFLFLSLHVVFWFIIEETPKWSDHQPLGRLTTSFVIFFFKYRPQSCCFTFYLFILYKKRIILAIDACLIQ